MAIKPEKSKDGIILRNTKTKRLAGRISTKGKDAPSTSAKKRQKSTSRSRKSFSLERVYRDMELANLKPLEDYVSAKTKWKCLCLLCGSEVNPKYDNIKQGQFGCNKTCRSRKIIEANLLDRKLAEEIMFNAGLRPLEPYTNSKTPWKSVCLKCGENTSPQLLNIQQGQGGCISCGLRSQSIIKRLSNEAAHELMITAGAEPLEEYPGLSNVKWKVCCLTCQTIREPRLITVIHGSSPCRPCAMKAGGLKGRTPANEAAKELFALGFIPLEPFTRVHDFWRVLCRACDTPTKVKLVTIRNGIGKCDTCEEAKSGPQYDKPSFLYLIEDGKAYKVGIMHNESGRIKIHENNGWTVMQLWSFSTGWDARRIEQEIIRWFREDLSILPAYGRFDMPQGGWTETVRLSDITSKAILDKIHLELSNLTNSEE